MGKYLFFLMFFAFSFSSNKADACTRVMYRGLNGITMTARSMDWKEAMPTNMWILPRGMSRNGLTGKKTVRWKSKYGSVVLAPYDVATADGMNEKGLVANLLWLAEAEYPVWNGEKPGLSISLWAQYVLDNFATVEETVKALEGEPFVVVSDAMPGKPDLFATLHMSVSDASGDNAIFEYVDGKLVISHSPKYRVMTNSPIFEKQLALNEYWKQIGGTVMLPGTNRAADRFVRASFYTDAVPVTGDSRLAVAEAFSIIRNTSVPYGISTPDQPNISSTLWRVVADQKDLIYFFESVLTPNIFWVNFHDVDFNAGAPTKVLHLTNNEIYSGNVASDFVASKPFEFLGV